MMPTSFVTHEEGQGGIRLECRGSIDVVNVDSFRSTLSGLRRSGLRRRHVDLSACEELDASGVAALAASTMELRSGGAVLSITRPASLDADRILDYSGLGALLAA